MARPFAAARINVPASDYQNARRLLRLWDASDGAVRNAIHCPECGSSRVQYPQFTRKFFLPNLVGILSVLGLVEKKFYCEDCQCTWSGKNREPSRPRPHMAPNYFIEDIPQPDNASNQAK